MGKRMRESSSKIKNYSKESTILLDSTDDTDIIENSILKSGSEQGFLKKGKINSSRINYMESPLQAKSFSLEDFKNRSISNENNDPLGFSLKKTYGLLDNIETVENTKLFETPCSGKNSKSSNSVMEKLISSLRKTPEGPYLSKTKLQNIQQWLIDNDTGTVNTPPFANLSVTPLRNSGQRKFSSHCKHKRKNYSESSMDSEVESVLKAVYGEDWKPQNLKNLSKTEPKKRLKKFFSPGMESKNTKIDSVYSIRRNILNTKIPNSIHTSNKENKLDNSILSGVKMINLNSSWSSDEQPNIKTLKPKCAQKETPSKEKSFRQSPQENLKPKFQPFNRMDLRKLTPGDFGDKKLSSENLLKTPKKTFLASLSVSTPTSRCHPDAQEYKVNFKSKKNELVKKLYRLYNSEVFSGKLPEELDFSWNVKLRGTAGYCYNKRLTKSTGEVIRLSRIEFSTKIVDRADRLRDTMIHELCHAASWVVDGMLDGHGVAWTKWVSRAMTRFPELPPIKRCHNYDIVSKYVYRCTSCGYSIKRHSKSINTDRKRCGHCYGVLELLINRKRKGKGEVPEFDTTRTLPTPNKFAIFVKENYHSVKSSKINAKHSEIMRTLSQQYATIKNGSTSVKK